MSKAWSHKIEYPVDESCSLEREKIADGPLFIFSFQKKLIHSFICEEESQLFSRAKSKDN